MHIDEGSVEGSVVAEALETASAKAKCRAASSKFDFKSAIGVPPPRSESADQASLQQPPPRAADDSAAHRQPPNVGDQSSTAFGHAQRPPASIQLPTQVSAEAKGLVDAELMVHLLHHREFREQAVELIKTAVCEGQITLTPFAQVIKWRALHYQMSQ